MRTTKRVLSAVLCVFMITASGCGGSGDGAKSNTDSGKNPVMGRYVEEEYSLEDSIGEKPNQIKAMQKLADGNLRMIVEEKGVFESQDQGKTWQMVDAPWWNEQIKGKMLWRAAISPDKSMVLEFMQNDTQNEEESEAESAAVTFSGAEADGGKVSMDTSDYEYLYVDAEGNAAAFTPQSDPNDPLIQYLFSDDNRLLAAGINGTIYELDVKSGAVLQTWEAKDPLIRISLAGDRLMAVTYSGMEIFSLETGAVLPVDEALQKMVETEQNMAGSQFFVEGASYLLAADEGNEGVFFAGKQGLYRHIFGGSMMEQISEGSLTSMGDPAFLFLHLIPIANDEFLAVYSGESGSHLMHYYYSADTPAVPDQIVKIYSLYDNQGMRQAIAKIQKENPSMQINYEAGLTGEDAVTVSDALRTLNTEIMAGKGPDILILDGMPIEAYAQKGLLMDLKDLLDSEYPQDTLFDNIARTYEKDGKICAVPTKFLIPVVQGPKEIVGQLTDLQAYADAFHKIREENPEGTVLDKNTTDPEQFLEYFYDAASPAWLNEDGTLKEEVLTQFYQLVKQMYEDQTAGLSEQDLSYSKDYYVIGGAKKFSFRTPEISPMNLLTEGSKMEMGYLADVADGYGLVTSIINKMPELAMQTQQSQAQDIFIPSSIIGVSSKCNNADAAREVVKRLLSQEVQELLTYDGFPVNQKAFDASAQLGEEDNQGVSISMDGDDSGAVFLEITKPAPEQVETLKQLIKKLKTPTLMDSVIFEAVVEQAAPCLKGDITPETAAGEVMKKVNLYLSE